MPSIIGKCTSRQLFPYGGLSFKLQDTVLAVSDLRQRVIARDQSDRSSIDHISHFVTSVCYLSGTILNIKYKFWENLSSLRAVVAIAIFKMAQKSFQHLYLDGSL